MNPRHKGTSATTQQQNVASTPVLETDEDMYNVHRSNHRAKPKGVRDEREREREREREA
jgi:hypothetical protein